MQDVLKDQMAVNKAVENLRLAHGPLQKYIYDTTQKLETLLIAARNFDVESTR